MIRIDFEVKPFWLDLACGVRLFCEPINPVLYEACKSEAITFVGQANENKEALEKLGAMVAEVPDLDSDAGRSGAIEVVFSTELACLAVTDWEGVAGLKGKGEAVPDEKNIRKIFSMCDVPGDFIARYLAGYRRMVSEGNV